MTRTTFLEFRCDRISILILSHQGVDFLISHIGDRSNEITYTITIDGIPESDLCFYFVAFGDCYLPHVITEPAVTPSLPVAPRQRRAQPRFHACVNRGILPMTDNHFATKSHARHYETELAIAMGALVQVHKVHVDGLPWNFAIKLRVQMKEWLAEYL